MKCARVRDLFSSYLENTAELGLRDALERHLGECAACRTAYDRFHATTMMLDEQREVELPPDFHERLMARVERVKRVVPTPVRWWQIDWQHVFTIRVPARAAAVGVAALLLVALTVQLTPLGTGVMNLLGLQKAVRTTVGEDQDTVPPWHPWKGHAQYDIADRGLFISVSVDSRAGETVYSLQFETKSDKPVAFDVRTTDRSYSGSVVSNQGWVVRIPVAASGEPRTYLAAVTWKFEGSKRSESIFLPSVFDRKASSKRLSLSFENATVREMLSKISRGYGVVVLASGDLDKRVPWAAVESGGPAEALFATVEDTAANMKRHVLAPSIYMVEPAR